MELTQLAQQSSPPVKEAEGYSSVVALAEEHFEEGLVMSKTILEGLTALIAALSTRYIFL